VTDFKIYQGRVEAASKNARRLARLKEILEVEKE